MNKKTILENQLVSKIEENVPFVANVAKVVIPPVFTYYCSFKMVLGSWYSQCRCPILIDTFLSVLLAL